MTGNGGTPENKEQVITTDREYMIRARLPEDLYRRLRHAAAEPEYTVQRVIREALMNHLSDAATQPG